MKKMLSKVVMVAISAACLLGVGQIETKASEVDQGNAVVSDTMVQVPIKNSSGTIVASVTVDMEDAEDGLQEALDYIYKRNTEDKPWTIVVPAGEYIIDNTLNIYSNTTLDLSAGVTLEREASFESTLIRFGRQEDIDEGYDVSGYDAYQNVTIIGSKNNYAVLDGSAAEAALLRFAHANNVTIQYVEFTNVTKAHHAEFAGCNNVLIDSCKFSAYNPQGEEDGNNHEALQIDILMKDNDHFPNYPEYDGTMNQNITITNNTFVNLNRGVGCHSGQVGKYMKNIKISNNTFTNINGYAIVATNFVNSNISNNKITNCGSGIYFRHITSEQINYYAGDSSSVNTNMNSVISNNTISLISTTFEEDDRGIYGIRVYGEVLSAKTNGIVKGDYRVSNIKITGNTISSTTFANGVWLQGVMNSTVQNNTVTYKISSLNTSKECDGVKLEASTNNTLSGNEVYDNSKEAAVRYGFHIKDASNNNTIKSSVVQNVAQSGIYLISSTGCTVSSNSITNPGEFGIYLSTKADASITSNAISGSGSNGIYLNYTSNSSTVDSNKIQNSGSNGIHLNNGSTVAKLTGNEITSSKGQGIYLNGKASCTQMEKNTISASKEQGIYVTDAAAVTNLLSNVISNGTKCGIYINGASVGTISLNSLSNMKQAGIGMAGSSSITKIGNNAISGSGSHGIYALGSAVCNSVESNVITASAEQGIYLSGSATMTNIVYNTITDSTKCGVYINGGTVAQICNNTINKKNNKVSATNGIYIASVKKQITGISSNNISNTKQVAIGIEGAASVAAIESNTLSGSGSHGIYACGTAKIDKVNKNKITTSTQQGIYLTGSATMTDITSNTITDTKKCGIYVSGGYVNNISKNTINKSKNKTSATNGIYITSVKKQINKIASNKVYNTSKIGIGLDGAMTVKTIEKNTLKSIGAQGIYIAKTSNAKKIYKNTLTTVKGNGIYISSTKASTNISSNTIKSCSKYGMDIGKNAKVTASNNTISSCKSGQVSIQGSKNKVINASSFKIKKISNGKKGVVLKWAKVSNVKSYVVYRSTSKNGTYKKIGTTTSGSYTDKTVKKNKTYYYKIVPVAKYSSTTMEFTATASKKIKYK